MAYLLALCLSLAAALQDGAPKPPQLPGVAADETPAARWKPVVGQPAPEIDCPTWIDSGAPSKGKVTTTTSVSSEGGVPVSRKAKKLADLADHVVIVHTFAWNDAAAKDKALPLVRDLVAANSDRKLAAIGIADGLELEAAKASAKTLGLEHPIALEDLAKSKSPYADLSEHAACFAFVVGRGGGLLWQGNPAQDEKGFLAAVKSALELHPVGRVERKLHDRLAKALTEYYAGRLSRAVAIAADDRKAAEKTGDKQWIEDTKLLDQVARETQLTWLRELENAAAKKDATTYVALVRACKAGLAKSDVQKDLDRLDKEAHKDGFFEMRLIESQKYLEMLDDRPVMFPARKESAGDKFAGKLEAFVRSTPNSTDETRTAKALADRYRLMAR
jgi:hypothetical protein